MEIINLKYKCELCDKYFSQSSSRNRHIQEKHVQPYKYHCEQCKSRFSKKYNLQYHIKQVHSKKCKPMQCCHCNRIFTKSDAFKKHLKGSRVCFETKNLSNDSSEQANETDAQSTAASVLKELKQLQFDIQTSKIRTPLCFENVQEYTNIEKNSVQVTTVKDSLYPLHEYTLLKAQTITNVEGLRYLICEFCDKKFRKTYNFLRHRRIHTKIRPYMCVLCKASFPTTNQLKSHSSIHKLHEKLGIFRKLYKCPKCDERFCAVEQFDKHISSLSKCKASFRCPKCFKRFDTLRTLLRHKHSEKDSELEMLKPLLPAPLPLSEKLQSSKIEEISFECNTCGMRVKEKTPFNQRMNRHENLLRNQCATCQKSFAIKSTLKIHNQKRLDAKNFKCHYCDNCFVTSQGCRRHMENHLKRLLQTDADKKDTIDFFTTFVENGANKSTTTTPTSIIKVKKTYKTKEKVSTDGKLKYKCSECEKAFRYNSWLKKHFKYKHTDEKQFKCSSCCKEFRTKQSLENHFLVHSTKRLKLTCQVCGKQYASDKSLKLHLRIHTQETPFTCKNCNRQFRTSGHLIQHCKSHHKKEL